jgi:hypothetical protein
VLEAVFVCKKNEWWKNRTGRQTLATEINLKIESNAIQMLDAFLPCIIAAKDYTTSFKA